MFHNNSASHGGALHLQNPAIIMVGSGSVIIFSYNHAKIYGGAIYAE